MARLADQYRRSDVRFWGIVAAITTVLAVASLNAPALIPDRIFSALHATRLPAPDNGVGELRAQITELKDQQASLTAAGVQLATRIGTTEQNAGEIRRDVSTLAANLPKLVRTVPIGSTSDDAMVTGAVGLPKPGISGAAAQSASDAANSVAAIQPVAAPSPAASATATQPVAAGPASAAVAAPASSSAASPSPVVLSSSQLPAAAAPTVSATIPSQPMASAPASATLSTDETPPASRRSDLVAEIGAYEWAQAAMTMSATPTVPASAASPVTPAPPAAPAQPSPPARPAAPTPVPLAPQRTLPAPAVVASAEPLAKADVRAVGVAIGAPVQPAGALAAWQDLASKIGVMLVGMSPLLAEDPAGGGGKVLVAGPVANIAAATALCGKIDGSGLTCTPMPYVGANLAPAQ